MSSTNSEAASKLNIDDSNNDSDLESAVSLNCHIDSNEHIKQMSAEYRRLFEVTEDAVVNNIALASLLTQGAYEENRPHIQKALTGEHSVQFVHCKNGRLIEFFYLPEIADAPISDSIGCFIIGFYRDATLTPVAPAMDSDAKALSLEDKDLIIEDLQTKLLSAQNRLVEHEKLATLGSLVPSVSHELNTPIGICTTGVSKLQMENNKVQKDFQEGRLTGDQLGAYLSDTEKVLGLAETNLRRSADLVQSFKKVGVSQSSTQFIDVDVAELFKDTVAALKPKYDRVNKNVNFNVDVPPGLTAYTSAGLLFQVLSNLIINSYLHGFDETSTYLISMSAEINDNLLFVEYSDDGRGLSDKAKKSIFEPYFTTDTSGQGSGLGMSIVHNIITEKLGGELKIHNEQNSGFHLNLRIPAKQN